jgi:hypothetical protein
MSAIINPCDCCRVDVPLADTLLDKDTEMIVCPECHKYLIAAKAQLARPFDEHGHKIALKGIHRR